MGYFWVDRPASDNFTTRSKNKSVKKFLNCWAVSEPILILRHYPKDYALFWEISLSPESWFNYVNTLYDKIYQAAQKARYRPDTEIFNFIAVAEKQDLEISVHPPFSIELIKEFTEPKRVSFLRIDTPYFDVTGDFQTSKQNGTYKIGFTSLLDLSGYIIPFFLETLKSQHKFSPVFSGMGSSDKEDLVRIIENELTNYPRRF